MRKADRQVGMEEAQARRRAELIIQVQAGRMSAAAAAAQMGVSRKTYYKWEQRGLSAILGSLREGKPGRRAQRVDPEKEQLRQEVETLRERVRMQEKLDRMRTLLREPLAGEPSLSATEKKGGA